MTFTDDGYGGNAEFEPPFDPDGEYGAVESREFRADAYEQLELTRAKRELEAARKAKFQSLLPCLVVKKELAAIQLDIAREQRLASEAERDRVRESRLCVRERRRASRDKQRVAEAESRAADAKRQAAHEVRRSAEAIDTLGRESQSSEQKLILSGVRAALDADTCELLACPQCGTRMGTPELGDGLLCPNCLHRYTSA